MKKLKLKNTEVLVLRKTHKNLTSHSGFVYPKYGEVEACDFRDSQECGFGLHGLEWGTGNFDIKSYGELFQVIRVDKLDGFVDLGDKIKYRKGIVILTTENQEEAIELIMRNAPEEFKSRVNFQIQTAGNRSTQTAGNRSTQTAGNRSTQTAGFYSTQTAGSDSTQTAGNRSTQTAGNRSTQTAGSDSTQTAGSDSTQTAGSDSTQTAGRFSFHCIRGNSAIIKPAKYSVIAMIDSNNEKSTAFTYGNDFQEGETLKIINMKIDSRYTSTPEKITTLKDYEIFVFGSNLNGNHAGGAAKLAKDKFKAEEKVSEGITGQSYAFPTLDKKMNKISLEKLSKSVENLIRIANRNTGYIFFLTKVGCGIAGFSESEIAPLFANTPPNIIKPENW